VRVGDPPPLHVVEVSTGISMAFRELGPRQGPTVLMLHAWGESSRSFDRVVASLPPNLHVFAVDLRGHGGTDKPLTGYDLVSLANDVVAFLDVVGGAPAVVLGASSGGYLAQQVAVLRPDLVRGLVMAGAPRSLAGRPDFADEIEELVDPISQAWAREFVGWFPVEGGIPDDYVAERVRDAMALPADVWRSSLAGLTGSDPPLRSGRIATPMLAIWGDRDALIPVDDQLALVGAVPGARRLVYEGVGHLVLWEQPLRLADDLAEFVEGLARPGGPLSMLDS
jgi:pimeloyl-ACP methyl ester carboxylesterase